MPDVPHLTLSGTVGSFKITKVIGTRAKSFRAFSTPLAHQASANAILSLPQHGQAPRLYARETWLENM